MAVHTGTAEERDGDYFGPAVNRAARLLGVGHGGQILLSQSAAALLEEGSREVLTDLGKHQGTGEAQSIADLAPDGGAFWGPQKGGRSRGHSHDEIQTQ